MRPRTFAALALALITLVVGVPSASATDPFPLDGILTLSNDNFTVHYNGNDRDTTCGNAITQPKAGEILGMLDRARSFYISMGWPAPTPDVDGRVHVSVDDFAGACLPLGAVPVGVPAPLDRWDAFLEPIAPGVDNIHLNATSALTYPFVAHEVFHLVEDAMVPAGTDQWLQEATAEWAAVRANKAAGGSETTIGRSLDCVGSSCGDSEYDKNGYPGWMLIEYLAERYNDAKVKALWDQVAANPGPATTNLAAVLDVPLATFYNDFANARMTGSFTHAALKGTVPATAAGFALPPSSGASDDLNVAVNHLAAAFVVFQHGTNDGPCFEGTMTINVTIPAGVESSPAYWAGTVGATARPLTTSGSNASLAVPWNTCGASADAYLSLPNDSLALDGREFVVKVSLTVDYSKPAAATSPPPGVHVIGTVVAAPASDPAPTLKVYAPEVLRVSTKTRLLRFVVFSSGDGKLQAVLGSASLGSAALRSGNNDVRFVLPTQLFKSLRAKSVSNVLSLTSQSPTGAKGATVTRKVVVQTPPKPKPKKKKPTKKH